MAAKPEIQTFPNDQILLQLILIQYLNDFDFTKDFNIIIIGLTNKELSDEFIFNSYFKNHKIDSGYTLVAIGYKENLDRFDKYMRSGY